MKKRVVVVVLGGMVVSGGLGMLMGARSAGRSAAPRPEPAPRRPVQHVQPAPPQQHATGVSPEVTQAQQNLQAVEKQLREEYEKQDEFVKAKGALKQAQEEHAAAVKAAVEKIKDKPEYAAAVEAQRKVEDELVTARLSGQGVDPSLATRVMDARMAVHKMEMDAGDADPAAKDAKEKVVAAREAVAKLEAGFEASMRTDKEYLAAKQKLDEARAAARGK